MWLSKLFYLFFVFNFLGLVISDVLKDESLDSKAHSERGGLWFGPRLGKRSLTNDKDELTASEREYFLKKMMEGIEDFKLMFIETLQKIRDSRETAKSITSVHTRSLKELHHKRPENMDFTPRLGRRLSHDMPATPPDADRADDLQWDRSNYFTPRLGRELEYGYYPERERFVRSVKSKPTK